MIERLEGDLLDIGADYLLVGLGGLGVRVMAPRSVVSRLDQQKHVVLWTRLLVRDGEPQLYGFLSHPERASFDALIGVRGVGPRIALGILSFLDPDTLALEVERGSSTQLLTVSGVGRKLANRILLELKGHLAIAAEGAAASGGGGPADAGTDAIRALTSLGYPPGEAREAVRAVLQRHRGEPAALDEIVREALTGLNRGRG